jgi:hypothetical protein
MAYVEIILESSSIFSQGQEPALPTNIRLEWMWQPLTNTLAYHNTECILTIYSIIVDN